MGDIAFESGSWLNPPPRWAVEDSVLSLTTGDRTDFWQRTVYGFHRDDGHALLVHATGTFTAHLRFEGDYRDLYDQAGLMLRVDAECWVKLGVEHSDGVTNFSVVVTRGASDWSVIPVPEVSGPQQVRLTRLTDAIVAHYQRPDGRWQLLRLADFPAPETMQLGPVACSPQRAGFEARFTSLSLASPIDDPVHATWSA